MPTEVPWGVTTGALEMVITQDDSGLDLSTVTGAVFNVRRADGTTTTWSAVITQQSTTQLTLTHVLQAGDCPVGVAGIYSIEPMLTVPAGPWPCLARPLHVVDPYSPS